MNGIKRIAGILEGLAVIPLPPAVEPDRYEREERKSLLAKLKVEAEDADGIQQPAHQVHVDPIERQHLPEELPPVPSAEKVEYNTVSTPMP